MGSVDKMLDRLKKLNVGSKEIIKDDSYLKYIEENIVKKGVLTSDYDYENPCKMEMLFDAIDKYASNNYVYPYGDTFSNYYIIKYKDKFYKVVMAGGQGIYFYIELVNNVDEYRYIEFEYIKDNKRQDNACDIDNKLAKVYYLIDTLYAGGVTVSGIKYLINKYLDNIDNKNSNDKIKQLKR